MGAEHSWLHPSPVGKIGRRHAMALPNAFFASQSLSARSVAGCSTPEHDILPSLTAMLGLKKLTVRTDLGRIVERS